MFRILRIFFIGMGILFTLLLCGLAYIVIADPFHIRPIMTLLMHSSSVSVPAEQNPAETTTSLSTITAASSSKQTTPPVQKTTPAPAPTPAQSEALKSVGINPSSFVSSVTPTQMECFVKILGESRVAEIKSGAVPTAGEFMSVSSCL